jgi:oligopeptide/dipeptide ABC transporter ATP-binding protein
VLLTVRDLGVDLAAFPLVEGVSFDLAAGRSLGLVGESGSGKTLAALALLGLVDPPLSVRGSVRLDGVELVGAGEAALGVVRGRRVGMIFQEPLDALNPVMSVGAQVAEGIARHHGLRGRAAFAEAEAWLGRVGVPPARAHDHPHQLSGGMRQRVMIAMALAPGPALLVADEPTTALDVSVQADVLALLARLREELGLALLLVSHDLSVVAGACDEICVMYAGQIVERGPARALLERPRHPYARGLVDSMFTMDGRIPRGIPGLPPPPGAWPPGCRFAPRCTHARPRCAAGVPPLEAAGGREVRCLFPLEAA